MKYDMSERFTYIETMLYWGGGVTAGQLAAAFGLQRQTAQTVIDAYRQQYPEALCFDASARRQVASTRFVPQHIRPDSLAFLNYLRAQAMSAYYRQSDDWLDIPFEDADYLLRPRLDTPVVQTVISALRNKQSLWISYQSRTTGWGSREIAPHRLVFADNRYHVRAYCYLRQRYADFVLSRMREIRLGAREHWVSDYADHAWHQRVTLELVPNPALTAAAQQALRFDHGLADVDDNSDKPKVWSICTRAALVNYLERELIGQLNPTTQLSNWVLQCKTPLSSPPPHAL